MAQRHAIYFTPPSDSRLARFGAGVIGYDALSGKVVPQLIPNGFSNLDWSQWTAEPARYGFHATLKAPFYLADDWSTDELGSAFRDFAAATPAIMLGKLEVKRMGSFVALLPEGPAEGLETFAQKIVEAFERFRAPLSEEDRARRLKKSLTDRQKVNLETFGYPYVGADFRFHMTLAGPLPQDAIADVAAALDRLYREHVGPDPVSIDALSLLTQDNPRSGFKITLTECLRPIEGQSSW